MTKPYNTKNQSHTDQTVRPSHAAQITRRSCSHASASAPRKGSIYPIANCLSATLCVCGVLRHAAPRPLSRGPSASSLPRRLRVRQTHLLIITFTDHHLLRSIGAWRSVASWASAVIPPPARSWSALRPSVPAMPCVDIRARSSPRGRAAWRRPRCWRALSGH